MMRVSIQQPALPHYRVPFFKLLSEEKPINIQVFYGESKELPNVISDGFSAKHYPMKEWRFLGKHIKWHSAQILCVDPKLSDIAVLCGDIQYLSLIPTLILGRVRNIPVLLWGHGYSKNESKWKKWVRDKVFSFSNGLIFYDSSTYESYVNSGWDENFLFVAPNALDQYAIHDAKNKYTSHDIEVHKQLFGLSEGPNIIYVGRIYLENNLHILINSLVDLVPIYKDLKLIIVGKENSVSDDLKKMSESLGVSSHIIWVGAIYKESDLAPWMMSSDIFCYPSNIGLSAIHALNYALPVVTDDNVSSHNPEIVSIRNGVNGKLFEHGNSKSLANGIRSILTEGNYKNMSLAAYKIVQSEYNIEGMVNGFFEAIKYNYFKYNKSINKE